MLYISGQLPFDDGKVVTGRLGADVDVASGYDAARRCALMLLAVLSDNEESAVQAYRSYALRVYTPEEQDALPQEVIGLLHFLENADAINGEQREFVIHALLHMPPDEITVDMAKVLTLLVLWAHKSELPVLIGDDLMMALHGVSTMH